MSKVYTPIDLDKELGYPLFEYIHKQHLDYNFRKRFIETFDNPTFGFITMICSKSDPIKLLLSLYSLLYLDFDYAMNIPSQNKILDEIKTIGGDKLTIVDCYHIARKISHIFESKPPSRYDKRKTNDVKLFVFREDYVVIEDEDKNIIENIYTIIQWFTNESKKLYPEMEVIHMKTYENVRVHVSRNLVHSIVVDSYPEVYWLNTVDDDDIQTSMYSLVRRFKACYSNNKKYKDDYNELVDSLKTEHDVSSVKMIYDELYVNHEGYNFIINCGNIEDGESNLISRRLCNTRCGGILNMLLNSLATEGEDATSLIYIYKPFYMISNSPKSLKYTRYENPSGRYDINIAETQLIMAFQQYLRMLAYVNEEKYNDALEILKIIK